MWDIREDEEEADGALDVRLSNDVSGTAAQRLNSDRKGDRYPFRMNDGAVQRTFLAVVVWLCLVLFVWFKYTPSIPLTTQKTSVPGVVSEGARRRKYLVDTAGCQIPAWDPFDPTVAKLLLQYPIYPCNGSRSFLTPLPGGVVRYNSTILRETYGIDNIDGLCTYKRIRRNGGAGEGWTDNGVIFGPEEPMVFLKAIQEDAIVVECKRNDTVFFEEYLPLVPLRYGSRRSGNGDCGSRWKTKLNVIMVGIDSVSYLNFERHFTRTKAFLTGTLKAVHLQGYTKVGDNTFPNLVPLLTGHYVEEYWNESMRDMSFDHLDFVWKEFAACGYKTFYAEDAPFQGAFNFLKRGFRRRPTDYYMRPFWVAYEKSDVYVKQDRNCFGSRLTMDVVYEHLANFAGTYGGTEHHFTFGFGTRPTHEHLNYAFYADAPAYRLLRRLDDGGFLKNSLLIFFSDHGTRYGAIRETYIGKFEERMPVMFLAFPDQFIEAYPGLYRNLVTNARRLTTPFDVHATLQHIASYDPGKPHRTVRGYSLLYEIPPSRTCSDASILPHWCTCLNMTSVPKSDPFVQNASKVLVDTINRRLAPYQDRCALLFVESINDAWASAPSDVVLRFRNHHNTVINRFVEFGTRAPALVNYMITITVKPSKAIFEATVEYDEAKSVYKVLGDVSRLDKYGHQADCIRNAGMRKFCYCFTR